MSRPGRGLGAPELDQIRGIAETSDVDLGVVLLRGTPTNQARPDEVLRRISARAQAFGRDLASGRSDGPGRSGEAGPGGAGGMTVVERRDGLDSGDPAVARFSHRTRTIHLYLDTVDLCEDLVDSLGWRSTFPVGSVRAAAVEHERAHDLISHAHAKDLRVAVAQPALAIGRWRRWAHVAGADELAAHAFAQAVLGLGRSPLLVTSAAVSALDAGHRPVKES